MAADEMNDGSRRALEGGAGAEGVSPPHGEAFLDILSELGTKMPARFVMLIDASGCGIATWGGRDGLDLASLSALAAGDLAASHEIARITGEFEEHQIVLREGHSSCLFVTDAGPQLVVLAQVGSEVPMGWARMLIKEAALRLAKTSFEAIGGCSESRPPVEAKDLCEALSRALDGELLTE